LERFSCFTEALSLQFLDNLIEIFGAGGALLPDSYPQVMRKLSTTYAQPLKGLFGNSACKNRAKCI
jgi:hypothetical protein